MAVDFILCFINHFNTTLQSEKITPFKVFKHPRDFRPTASEREAMTRQFSEKKLTVDALTAQINSMSRVVRELKQRRDELQTSLVHGADLSSPIRKLPVELLQRIFTFCIPRIKTRSFTKKVTRIRWTKETHIPSQPGTRYTRYQIIGATPDAWSTVVVEKLTEARIMEFGYCTKLSKAAPLDLYIHSHYLAATNRVLLLDTMQKCVHRTKRLFIDFEISDDTYDLEQIIELFADNRPSLTLQELGLRRSPDLLSDYELLTKPLRFSNSTNWPKETDVAEQLHNYISRAI
ncbi:hypothetical protein M422DRAFT_254317 [Sphaerobolus stellatus SS14]|uniref:F-box domain-containing protein n=1 Tax=Sphaerobolus stellatus (strain SS14) TaxID=990650 RepID=A0A0C9VLD4_SPHS4|nr:hypothetical protein M422DRAFT_254317 [Sphaerobolus stellatus SS14]